MPPTNSIKKNGNEHLRRTLTNEMLQELEETFHLVAESKELMPVAKLPLALKALGMSMQEAEGVRIPSEGVDFDKFVEVVIMCMKQPNWAANEMLEVFNIFDKDTNGYLDPNELRRVFERIGENLMQTEVEDQLREVDIDGDLKMVVAEFYNMVSNTKGTEFTFEDSLA